MKTFSGRKALVQEFVKTGDRAMHNGGGRINRVAKTAKGDLITDSLFKGKADYLHDITSEQKRNIEAGIKRREAKGIKTDTSKIEKMLDNRANAIDQMRKGTINKQLIRSSL